MLFLRVSVTNQRRSAELSLLDFVKHVESRPWNCQRHVHDVGNRGLGQLGCLTAGSSHLLQMKLGYQARAYVEDMHLDPQFLQEVAAKHEIGIPVNEVEKDCCSFALVCFDSALDEPKERRTACARIIRLARCRALRLVVSTTGSSASNMVKYVW